MSSSCPYQRVAVLAATMLCASTILAITPPLLLAAAISVGLRPSCSAVIFCRLPKSTFEDVSDPVRAAPQPAQRPPEERVQHARLREGQAQRRVQARVTG